MLKSAGRNFTSTGGGGAITGISLKNAAMVRKMPWGDRWQYLRIGLWFNVEVNGIVRDSTQSATNFFVGVCSGPWSVGDHLGRTWRAAGLSVLQANAGVYPWASSWDRVQTGGENVWRVTSSSRGGYYTVQASQGSYETGGIATSRTNTMATIINNGGQIGIPDATGVQRRTALYFDLYRQPYGTVWNGNWRSTVYNHANMALDLPLKSYLEGLGQITTSTHADPWYGVTTQTSSTIQSFSASVDCRNSPIDYVDLYWDSPTMSLELWRFDVLRLS